MLKKKKTTASDRRDNILGWLFCSPYLIFSLVFFLIPLCWAFWLSTMEWNLMSPNKAFVGLNNFKQLFSDSKVQAAFINSFKYLIPTMVFCFLGGLVIALLVTQLPEKLKGMTAVLFFIPYLTSGVATSVVVKYLFSYNSVLNVFLREHFDLNISWFKDGTIAFWVITVLVVWKMSGYYALFILSAIEGVSEEVKEAARLDGSTGFHYLIHVTIPMIMPALTTVLVLASGLAFGIYTEPYLLTGGGPSLATTTWQLEIYYTSFTRFQSGYGAAMAIANAIQIFIVLRIINFVMNHFNEKYGW